MNAVHAGIGWALLFVALSVPGYLGIWLVVWLVRILRPVRRLSWLQSVLLTGASGTAAIALLPLLVHALLGRPPH